MAKEAGHKTINLEKVGILAEAGISEKDIAKLLDVKYKTWQLWKTKNPDINRTLKKAKEKPMSKVINSLHRSAEGFHYTEYKTVFEGTSKKVRQVEKFVKYSKPSDTACIYLTKVKSDWHDGAYAPKPMTKEEQVAIANAMNGTTIVEEVTKH